MTTETKQTDGARAATSGDSLTITDNRTGKQYEVPIEDGTIRATELRKIKTRDDFSASGASPAPRNTQNAIVCSHYDTKLFSTIRFVGADDGASSTGALLELARVLRA